MKDAMKKNVNPPADTAALSTNSGQALRRRQTGQARPQPMAGRYDDSHPRSSIPLTLFQPGSLRRG
jgi:hypothetical protein